MFFGNLFGLLIVFKKFFWNVVVELFFGRFLSVLLRI